MGSYCGIHFGDLSIFDEKSFVPDDWGALFQESERQEETRSYDDGSDETFTQIEYRANRETILRRLSLMGATSGRVSEAFESWLTYERETWGEYAEEWEHQAGDHAARIADGLSQLDYPRWQKFACDALRERYEQQNDQEDDDPFLAQFRGLNGTFLYIDGYGTLTTLRALLESCPDVKEVRLDVSELVNGGYYERFYRISDHARLAAQTHSLSPTMILGEGSSDLLVLRLALAAMYPGLLDYFSFFNHSELSVDGGANYLVKFLKAFAAARSSSRMLAVFDNDAIGIQALKQAKALALPPNIIVTKLPDTKLASSYPTIGPSGPARDDVNGRAAGIELYLGTEALARNGELRPVRWGGFIGSIGKYQGEVEGKTEVLNAFKKLIAAAPSPEAAKERFPDLRIVWEHIFDLVEEFAGSPFLRAYKRPEW